MFEFCPNCNTKMIQKPLFTSFYEECPKCDRPNEIGGVGLNSNQINTVFESVFKHGDLLIHSGTGIKGKIIFKGPNAVHRMFVTTSDEHSITLTDYEEAFQLVNP